MKSLYFLKNNQREIFVLLSFLLFFSVFIPDLKAQQKDSLDYFPLKEGNKYHNYLLRFCPEDSFHHKLPDSIERTMDWIKFDKPVKINSNEYFLTPLIWNVDTVRKDSSGNLLYYFLGQDQLFFILNAKVGEVWKSLLPLNSGHRPYLSTLIMKSRTDTIVTYAGIFYNCLRIYLTDTGELRISYWMAPNFGIVALAAAQGNVYILCEAEVDGKKYTITKTNELSNPIKDFILYQNYPNPFNPETVIRFKLNESGMVRLIICDESGKIVRNLINSSFPSGSFEERWNGKNNYGEKVSSGVYFCQLIVNKQQLTKKIALLK
jgi:hypothetical protein